MTYQIGDKVMIIGWYPWPNEKVGVIERFGVSIEGITDEYTYYVRTLQGLIGYYESDLQLAG